MGLGFVACQTYIVAVCGHLHIKKQNAFSFGPQHSSGQTVVRIANHAANYWKHNSEWFLDRNERQRKDVEVAFEAVGFPVGTDYPLLNLLTEITYPQAANFVSVVELLVNWKDELYKEH